MQPFNPADLTIPARALLAVSRDERIALADRMVTEAEIADEFRKKTGVPHLDFGTGSLESAARAYPLAPEPRFSDREYMACMESVIAAVLRVSPLEAAQ